MNKTIPTIICMVIALYCLPVEGRKEFHWGKFTARAVAAGAVGAGVSTLCKHTLKDDYGCWWAGFTSTLIFGTFLHMHRESSAKQRYCDEFAGIGVGSLIGPTIAISF